MSDTGKTTAPERIYLSARFPEDMTAEAWKDDQEDIAWHYERMGEDDAEYIRADLVEKLKAKPSGKMEIDGLWTKEIPTEAGWYKTRGYIRTCIEAVEIAGLIFPALPHSDWEPFRGCEFLRVEWDAEQLLVEPKPITLEMALRIIECIFDGGPINAPYDALRHLENEISDWQSNSSPSTSQEAKP